MQYSFFSPLFFFSHCFSGFGAVHGEFGGGSGGGGGGSGEGAAITAAANDDGGGDGHWSMGAGASGGGGGSGVGNSSQADASNGVGGIAAASVLEVAEQLHGRSASGRIASGCASMHLNASVNASDGDADGQSDNSVNTFPAHRKSVDNSVNTFPARKLAQGGTGGLWVASSALRAP